MRSCKNKVLRAGDAAENDRPVGNVLWQNAAAHAPDQLAIQGESIWRGAAGQNDRVGAAQGGQRLAETSGGQEAVSRIFRRDQDDIEIAGEGAVLEAIVEQVELRSELVFRENSSCVAVLANDDGYSQTSGHEQRFISKVARGTARVDQRDPFCLASVAAGEDVELHPT